MAYSYYIKRKLYLITDDKELRDELFKELIDNNVMTRKDIIRLFYYLKPMTLQRWSLYLTPSQMEKYLDEVDKDGNYLNKEAKDIDEDENFEVEDNDFDGI